MQPIPPTPTPFATDPEIMNTLPDALTDLDISLWDFTDEAIQVWNSVSNLTIVFQVITLLLIIIGGAFIIVQIIRQLVTSD